MTGLVEDLLLLARLDAGRPISYESTDLSPLTYESTDLSPLVVDAVSDARAAGQGHTWRLELPDDPALVPADGARIHQVLVNLLANARTHTPPGTTVTARVRREGAGWWWRCWTTARVFRPSCSRTSSNGSPAGTPHGHGTPVRPGSVSRSCRRSWWRTAGR